MSYSPRTPGLTSFESHREETIRAVTCLRMHGLPDVLERLLRAVHANADRGELKALLVEAWGASPAGSSPTCPRCAGLLDGAETVAALSAGWPRVDAPVCLKCRGGGDLRGLAARESQR